MDQVRAMKNIPVPAYDVARLDMAVLAFTRMGSEKALRHMASTRLADYKPIVVGTASRL
jgi:hypothetical protein